MYIACSPLLILAACIWQKICFLLSFGMLNLYLVPYLNNVDLFGDKWWWPTLDGPTHFPLDGYLPFLGKSQAKFVINLMLVGVWWLQHYYMAKSYFKNWIYEKIGYRYAPFERSNFLFGSFAALLIQSWLWQKDSTVLMTHNLTFPFLPLLGWGAIGFGFLYFVWTLWEMLLHDIFGFNYMRQLKWNGFEFPFSESLKPLTRFNLVHRHPIYFCLFCFFGGALLTNPLTIGRAFQIVPMLLFNFYGTKSEEVDSKQFKGYDMWLSIIKNRWVPNFSMLYIEEKELNRLRMKIDSATN